MGKNTAEKEWVYKTGLVCKSKFSYSIHYQTHFKIHHTRVRLLLEEITYSI